jgi:predicted site-specific integrase-resolvase
LVSAIWKRFEKYKAEALKSSARADKDKEDLIADLVDIVYSCTARLQRQRRAKRKTERIVQELQTEEKYEAC